MAFNVVHESLAANGALLLAILSSPTPLHEAWQHTGEIWRQTLLVFAHHPFAILFCAVVPAIERGYVLLRGPWLERRRIAFLELLVTLWRVLLCLVAVWAACSGQQVHDLSEAHGEIAAWQIVLAGMGTHIAHHLRMVLWELLFFAAGMLLLYLVLTWISAAVARAKEWETADRHRAALQSVLRNLILAPILVIYLVEITRPAFQ